MRTQLPFALLVTAIAYSLGTAPASARARVFVASYGNDSNPCTFGSPCKTFQQAHDVVDAGGEVTAIDSAGFGPISISKAVTITSPDGVEAGIVPVSGGNAITINAGPSDAIVLRGLTLDGSGVGANGVVFNSGGSLTVTNCVAQNFVNTGPPSTGNGILLQPSSGAVSFAITNTIALNNGHVGVFYVPSSGSPSADGIIDHVQATRNVFGIVVNGALASGSTADVAISNSIAGHNSTSGIVADGGHALTMSIDNTTVKGNANGIQAFSPASVLLTRSVIQGNGVGIQNSTPNTFYTYGNNLIDLNTTNISSPLNKTFSLQ